MRRPKYRKIAVAGLIFIVIAALAWKYTFRKTETNVSSRKAEYNLDASVLVNAFETDENAANELYLNRIISVTGTVESVSEDSIGISVYLKEPDALSGIICGFELDADDITGIDKGEQATIKGLCTGYLMDVVFNKCSVEKGRGTGNK